MSDPLQTLIDRGAACVGGDVILRNKSMGRLKNGVFDISPDGLAELEVTEVEAKPVAPKPAKEPKAPKAAKKPDPEKEPEPEPGAPSLDDLELDV